MGDDLGADADSMGTHAFSQRRYRIDQDRTVVCDTPADPAELDALRDALGWRRRSLSLADLQAAESVLALRDVTALDDRLAAAIGAQDAHRLLTVDRDEALMLCECASTYVRDRDADGYQSPDERTRISRLRALAGPLMDCCCELAAAEDEAREQALPA
ncbi:MAG: hypothetical protein M3296_03835 [Actinomycetota bacterium]|nr:hypothetical protein [Actinomycetota bacterium]